jgi:hypothetical protein
MPLTLTAVTLILLCIEPLCRRRAPFQAEVGMRAQASSLVSHSNTRESRASRGAELAACAKSPSPPSGLKICPRERSPVRASSAASRS